MKPKAKEDNFMYVRLDNEEGVMGKRSVLSVQMGLLRILKSVRNFHRIRSNELKLKARLLKMTKETNLDIKKIQINIPKLTTSLHVGLERISKPEIKNIGVDAKTSKDKTLESQLRDIQEKLKALQR